MSQESHDTSEEIENKEEKIDKQENTENEKIEIKSNEDHKEYNNSYRNELWVF